MYRIKFIDRAGQQHTSGLVPALDLELMVKTIELRAAKIEIEFIQQK
jgi:hypothetical protein